MAKVYKGDIVNSVVELNLDDEAAGGGGGASTLEGLTDTTITNDVTGSATTGGTWSPDISGLNFTQSGEYGNTPYYVAADAFGPGQDATLSNYTGFWIISSGGPGGFFDTYVAQGPTHATDPTGSYSNSNGFTSTGTIDSFTPGVAGSLVDGYVLTWNDTGNTWEPAASGGGGGGGGLFIDDGVTGATERITASTATPLGPYATISGGANNTASADSSTVGGGLFNTASGTYYSTVGGGNNNTASEFNSTVGGGGGNFASGYASTVSGGTGNTASGYYSTVSGGKEAKADKYGQQAYSAGQFAAQGDAQTSLMVVRNPNFHRYSN